MSNSLANNYTTFRKVIKSIRKTKGFTQIQLSNKLDKPQSYVSKYENGDRKLDIIEVYLICKACNTSLFLFSKALEKALDTTDD